MFLIGQAIVARNAVPWDDVHSKAWMRGKKSTIPDEVAIASETHVPAPFVASQRSGILKIRSPPSPPPVPLDPREPSPIAGPCQQCRKTQAPCQSLQGWLACIPCHTKKQKCSLTPVTRAYTRAVKNREVLDSSHTATRKVSSHGLQPSPTEILDEARKLEARQEEILRGMEDIRSMQKRLYEVIESWESTEEHDAKRRRT